MKMCSELYRNEGIELDRNNLADHANSDNYSIKW